MNTYETMKHNIPEGATHYSDESEDNHFCWYIIKGDVAKIFSVNKYEQKWRDCINQHKENDVKPIPTEPTYRYEKVTDSIFDLKEEFERGELYAESDKGNYLKVECEGLLVLACHKQKLYRRIEVTERDLFIEEACEKIRTSAEEDILIIGKMYDLGARFVNGKG